MTSVRIAPLGREGMEMICPYNADFIRGAHRIGGEWDAAGRRWKFAGLDEWQVRKLTREVFGTDGSAAQEEDGVTVHWAIGGLAAHESELSLRGRVIARRRDRRAAVSLSRGGRHHPGRVPGVGRNRPVPRPGPA
ncbi:hypothetical protein ID875_21320 [Streptomyces globisporus]|uniref:Uncharacterized protein n=1 Tax=Streptomyces globisporus TaxID=1908 RepID=A0A927GNT0_STRGL|nr:hypothetical protein [Streptomyces globisporus]